MASDMYYMYKAEILCDGSPRVLLTQNFNILLINKILIKNHNECSSKIYLFSCNFGKVLVYVQKPI